MKREDELQKTDTTPTERGEAVVARAPYRRPVLRRLGSVRELTLGKSAGTPEGGGTFFPTGKT
jgi:hypothetical protein